MKFGLYFGLAKDGIRKNRRMYLPYIMTCIGMVMMYYIIMFLQYNPIISTIRGGRNAQTCLGLGGWIIALFSCIFLFYTNSFLIRRRKKEFGLYNILGMGRRHICYILFWESLIVAVLSLVLGLISGILFSKIAELGMVNLLKLTANYAFHVSGKAIFGVIFALLYLNNLRQIRFQSTLVLLGSEKTGEKPPKANWVFGILGVVILTIAYYMSVTIKNPLAALTLFFWVVLLVVIGTYLLMITGSVLLCRILQKNKGYYYKKSHFVSVSSLVYRMKRNGAGLASICILSTMVLIMISSTSCLYFGSEDSLKNHFPKEVLVSLYVEDAAQIGDRQRDEVLQFSEDFAKERNVTLENEYYFRAASLAGVFIDNRIETDVKEYSDNYFGELSNLVMVYFVPVSDLCSFSGKEFDLQKGEALLYSSNKKYQVDTFAISDKQTFQIKEILQEDYLESSDEKDVIDSVYLFVPDIKESLSPVLELVGYNGDRVLHYNMAVGFDPKLEREEKVPFFRAYEEAFYQEGFVFKNCNINSREANREDFFITYGGLFYLGIILSIVFILAAALIIYYKQISEGYEDQARFEIMQKVGMTKKEIRKSIDSQMLTVFFFPLLLAGAHVCFAFPVIKKMLALFGLFNSSLFVITSFISFLIFTILYVLVYRATSNAYFNIVSNATT